MPSRGHGFRRLRPEFSQAKKKSNVGFHVTISTPKYRRGLINYLKPYQRLAREKIADVHTEIHSHCDGNCATISAAFYSTSRETQRQVATHSEIKQLMRALSVAYTDYLNGVSASQEDIYFFFRWWKPN